MHQCELFNTFLGKILERIPTSEAKPLKLGNAEFWIDNGEFIHNPATSNWDYDKISDDMLILFRILGLKDDITGAINESHCNISA